MPFMVESATELTLGAIQNLKDAERLQWKTKDHTTDGSKSSICYFKWEWK